MSSKKHSPKHASKHSLKHSLKHALKHSLRHSLKHSLKHSLNHGNMFPQNREENMLLWAPFVILLYLGLNHDVLGTLGLDCAQ